MTPAPTATAPMFCRRCDTWEFPAVNDDESTECSECGRAFECDDCGYDVDETGQCLRPAVDALVTCAAPGRQGVTLARRILVYLDGDTHGLAWSDAGVGALTDGGLYGPRFGTAAEALAEFAAFQARCRQDRDLTAGASPTHRGKITERPYLVTGPPDHPVIAAAR